MKHPKAITRLDAQIGKRIKAAREEANVSQQALAHTLGVSWQQLQKYEGAINRISASRLCQIASCLGVKASELLGENT